VVLEPRRRLGKDELARFASLLLRRRRREPLAYVLGSREFWSLDLRISPDVLIPRPETEILVEAAVQASRELRPPAGSPPVVVDLCTGSGAVAIAMAREIPDAWILATDISPEALRVARANAAAHGVGDRITFLCGDLWQPIRREREELMGRLDMVVANPPYIPSDHLATLMPEVRWEPRKALDGGRDGLRALRRIIAGAPQPVRPGGFLLLEVGAHQAAEVSRLIQVSGEFEEARLLKDLAGRDRVVVARRCADGMQNGQPIRLRRTNGSRS
jgi:release factor glutamine methyltransferase